MSGRTPRKRPNPWLSVVVLGLLPLATRADEPVPAGGTIASDPLFTALSIDGATVSGRIRQISPEGDVTLVPADGPEKSVAFGKLIKLTREGMPPPFPSGGSLVLFPGGDRLQRTVIGAASETTLNIHPYALGNLAVPLESLLGLVLTPPDETEALENLVSRIRGEPRTSEVLWLANGDRVTGGLLGLDDKKVKFQSGNGPIALDRPGVLGLGFDPTLVVYPEAPGATFELTMADGSRLSVSNAKIEQGQVVATTRFNVAIRVALSDLVRAHTRSSTVAYLSDRDASATQYVGYVGPTRPYRRDLSVDGHPLRLGGQTYDRGLGTQSRTLLAYRLAPGDLRFQATVGLDESAGPLGSVVFRVLLDGREKFATPPMAVNDVPKSIDVDVKGGKVLILVTEFGDRGEVRDFADWIEARLIR
ncbi:NPCBM/NEW2 domain-containing protein [Singulisphaera rosea]